MVAWKSGLFGCFSNASLSLTACCLAPVAIARQAEYIGDKHPVAWIIATLTTPCVAGAVLRGKIRQKKVTIFLTPYGAIPGLILH